MQAVKICTNEILQFFKRRLLVVVLCKILAFHIRDVNSREIAFPVREMQFPGLDRDSRFHPSTYLLPAWLESAGARRGGRSPAGPWHRTLPVPGPRCRLWTIDRHRRQWCTQSVTKRPGGDTEGAQPGKHNGRLAPGWWETTANCHVFLRFYFTDSPAVQYSDNQPAFHCWSSLAERQWRVVAVWFIDGQRRTVCLCHVQHRRHLNCCQWYVVA